jgi:hypothetical protein
MFSFAQVIYRCCICPAKPGVRGVRYSPTTIDTGARQVSCATPTEVRARRDVRTSCNSRWTTRNAASTAASGVAPRRVTWRLFPASRSSMHTASRRPCCTKVTRAAQMSSYGVLRSSSRSAIHPIRCGASVMCLPSMSKRIGIPSPCYGGRDSERRRVGAPRCCKARTWHTLSVPSRDERPKRRARFIPKPVGSL